MLEPQTSHEILIFVGDILQHIRPEDDQHYVELHPNNPGAFEEEQRNLPLMLTFLEGKKSLSSRDLAQQNPSLRRSERAHARSQDRLHWAWTHAAWSAYSLIFHAVYPLVLTQPASAMEKMASAVPSRFWEYFWGYAEEADLLELMRFLCDTMVPLLCPRREQWLACNEALRARSERRRPRNRDKRMMDTEAAGMQAALIATGIIIVPRASALSSHAMKDLPPTRYSAAPGYLFLW